MQIDAAASQAPSSGAAESLELHLIRRHGLTRAEASLAASLMAGLSLAEHGIARGVDDQLLYRHRAALQRKLGCDGLEALTARLAASQPQGFSTLGQ